MEREPTDRREPLTRARIVDAAIGVADAGGLEAVSMRRLANELGVAAMSLYHHVAGKDAVLDGMVDRLVDAIESPVDPSDWKATLRRRAHAGRTLFRRHAWAPALIATRSSTSRAIVRYLDAVARIFLDGGFSHQLTHTATHVLDSRILGFPSGILEPGDAGPELDDAFIADLRAGRYPTLAELLVDIHHDGDAEFDIAFDLILDGLERARDRERAEA